MQQIKERPDATLLQTMLLRSMQQAVYSPDNVGHFGLAYEALRPLHQPDPPLSGPADAPRHQGGPAGQEVRADRHRPVEAEHDVSNATRKQQAKDKAAGTQKDPKDLTIWDALGVHCSANERRADEASRDVENWLKCYYMKDRLGEEFTGVISGVTPFGIFVQLDELFVEGLVHVTGLGRTISSTTKRATNCAASAAARSMADRPRDRAGGARRPRSAQDRPRAGQPEQEAVPAPLGRTPAPRVGRRRIEAAAPPKAKGPRKSAGSRRAAAGCRLGSSRCMA
jgi:ribonuclease R